MNVHITQFKADVFQPLPSKKFLRHKYCSYVASRLPQTLSLLALFCLLHSVVGVVVSESGL